MRRLHFGARARRRKHARTLALVSLAITVAAAIVGLDSNPAHVDFLGMLDTRQEVVRSRGVEASDSAAAMIRFRRKVFEARPAPTPTPTPTPTPAPAPSPTPAPTPMPAPAETVAETPTTAPAAGGSVSEIIYAAAAEFGISGDTLLSIASCESGLDPQAHNPAGYYGLFQFDQQTWGAYGYGSIYDPVAQARTAARLVAAGQTSRWPTCV